MSGEYKYIGKRIIREDSSDKVRGFIKYLADEPPRGCLFGDRCGGGGAGQDLFDLGRDARREAVG